MGKRPIPQPPKSNSKFINTRAHPAAPTLNKRYNMDESGSANELQGTYLSTSNEINTSGAY